MRSDTGIKIRSTVGSQHGDERVDGRHCIDGPGLHGRRIDGDRTGPGSNTGNLGSSDDVDQIWWRLDEVPVDGFLGGERGAVGAAYDAGVVPATALVEPFEQLSDRLSGGAA